MTLKPEELTVLATLTVRLVRTEREAKRLVDEIRDMKEEVFTIGIRLQGSDVTYEGSVDGSI